MPPPMGHLGSRLATVRLIVERTDDLRRGTGSLPALHAAKWNVIRMCRRLIVPGKGGVCFEKGSALRSPWRLAWACTSIGESDQRGWSLESTDITSYTCSIVHRDASSGASKSRIESINPAPALCSLICRAAPRYKLIQTPYRHCNPLTILVPVPLLMQPFCRLRLPR